MMSRAEFKQRIILALLRDLEWMPKFSSVESAAKHLGVEAPETDAGAIELQQQMIAVQVNETANKIVVASGF
jgi:hypothetical protein